jgi:ribosomal protein S18 acetylase RimI-like enzyme
MTDNAQKPAFRLRRAEPVDAPRVADLFHRSFTATFGHLYPPEDLAAFLDDCSVDMFTREISGADFACMLGEDADGRLLGYCTLGPQESLPVPANGGRRWIVLRQLYLVEHAKGTGLAQALMDWALAEARARGFEDVVLTVYVDNHRARRLYEKAGFVEVGSYAFRVGSIIDDDRIMRCALC